MIEKTIEKNVFFFFLFLMSFQPHFSDSTSPRPAASPIGWSGPHTANQNGGDLYPYDDETGQAGHM